MLQYRDHKTVGEIQRTIESLKNVPRITFSSPSSSCSIYFSGRVHPDHIQQIIYLSTTRKGLEVSLDSSFLSTKEIEKSCTKPDGEHLAEPEIEELSPCPTTSLICISKTNYPSVPRMTEEEIQSGSNEEMGQYHQDYIKHWFQITIQSKYHSHLQVLFVSHLSKLLIFHAHVPSKVYMLNLSMNIYLYLLHTWLHWKYSFI